MIKLNKEKLLSLFVQNQEIMVERLLDEEAEAYGYKHPENKIPSIDRACSYAAYPNKYQKEAQSFVAWRADVWEKFYSFMDDIKSGKSEMDDVISMLPKRIK